MNLNDCPWLDASLLIESPLASQNQDLRRRTARLAPSALANLLDFDAVPSRRDSIGFPTTCDKSVLRVAHVRIKSRHCRSIRHRDN
jgi:hypothetical protein